MFDIINVSHRVFNLSLYYDSSMAQAREVSVLQNFAAERRHLQNRFQSWPSYNYSCLLSNKWGTLTKK